MIVDKLTHIDVRAKLSSYSDGIGRYRRHSIECQYECCYLCRDI